MKQMQEMSMAIVCITTKLGLSLRFLQKNMMIVVTKATIEVSPTITCSVILSPFTVSLT